MTDSIFRRGSSLVEMIVAMGIASILLSTMVSTMQIAFTTSRNHVNRGRSFLHETRFMEQMRSDFRYASETQKDGDDFLVRQSKSMLIRYRFTQNSILREVVRKDATPSRENMIFERAHAVNVHIDNDEGLLHVDVSWQADAITNEVPRKRKFVMRLSKNDGFINLPLKEARLDKAWIFHTGNR